MKGLYRGKLDWLLLRGFEVDGMEFIDIRSNSKATRLDNNKYDASDHKSLTADVRLSNEDPSVLREKCRKQFPAKNSNGSILIIVSFLFLVFWKYI